MPAQQLLPDLSSVSRLERSAKPAQQPLPDLSRASPSERSMIEGTCSYKKRSDGAGVLLRMPQKQGRRTRAVVRAARSQPRQSFGALDDRRRLLVQETVGRAGVLLRMPQKQGRRTRAVVRAARSQPRQSFGALDDRRRLLVQETVGRAGVLLRMPQKQGRRTRAVVRAARSQPRQSSERSMIEGACSYKKRSDGPASTTHASEARPKNSGGRLGRPISAAPVLRSAR